MLNVYEESEIKEHFGEITDEIKEYAKSEALSFSRYIFVSSGKKRKAYCTNCDNEFAFDGARKIKQNMPHVCPECKKRCLLRKEWVGRKYLMDQARFLWFEKSKLNKDMIVASWFYCSRDYSGSYKNVKTECSRETLYLFEIGNPRMYEIYSWDGGRLNQRKTIFNPNSNLPYTIAEHKLKKVTTGTKYRHSGWEHYRSSELTKYFALFSEMPNIEILTKSGFENIVRIKIYGEKTNRAIDWKAERLHQFFKVSKNDFKEMNQLANAERDVYTLKGRHATSALFVWQRIRKNKEKTKYKEALTMMKELRILNHETEFNNIRKFSSIIKMSSYIKKQTKISHLGAGQALIAWSDYLNDCKRLEMDTSDKSIVYPRNLYEAHQRTIELVEIQEDEITDQKIKRRQEELKNLHLEKNGIFIRPPQNFEEIIREGKVLKHCVGTYAERHANKNTTLLFIREKSRPEKPFYTMEISRGRVHQVRGYKNKDATKEVEKFVELFKEEKLKTKKARNVG